MEGDALVQVGDGWRWYRQPRRVVIAWRPDQVVPALEALEAAVEGEGLEAVGYLAFEGAAAFGLPVHDPLPGLPLLWFGLYDTGEHRAAPPAGGEVRVEPWSVPLVAADYARRHQRIHRYLHDGDSYQVNFTFPLEAAFQGDPLRLFAELAGAQRGAAGMTYLDTGRFAVCCASPELYLHRHGDALTARPMKGTARRQPAPEADRQAAERLRADPKERAENVMIVDMIRNDLGRVADTGSVAVPELFRVERYPTVLQMTSTVTARSRASLAELLAATFPCASVTGAPKVRTLEIIRELEAGPRGVYTGAVGWFAPGRQAHFNVAIRTAVLDRQRGWLRYGVGSGVVADSTADAEYRECLDKAAVLGASGRGFRLLETLRWDPGAGYFLLEEHLTRLGRSAAHFGLGLDPERVRAALEAAVAGAPATCRVRALVGADGRPAVEVAPLAGTTHASLRVGLALSPVDPADPWLRHKTTRREVYQAALAGRPDCDEVILYTADGELTEAATANLVLELDGRLLTPRAEAGLLPGTFRERLLREGTVAEARLQRRDLARASRAWLVNSVREWQPAVWVDDEATWSEGLRTED